MDPDDFKQAWQTQSSQTRLTIDAELLLKEVRRNQRYFTATIFWRDVREVGVGLLMVPLWLYLGVKHSLPWTWYLMVPALLWVAGYMLADRMRHKRQPPEPGEPLRQRVESSLAQVEHQIWLLRNALVVSAAFSPCDLWPFISLPDPGGLAVGSRHGRSGRRGNDRRGGGFLLGNPKCYPLQP